MFLILAHSIIERLNIMNVFSVRRMHFYRHTRERIIKWNCDKSHRALRRLKYLTPHVVYCNLSGLKVHFAITKRFSNAHRRRIFICFVGKLISLSSYLKNAIQK